MALLKVLKGPNPGHLHTLVKPETILGREGAQCDIIIPYQAVSRSHAKIGQADGGYYIEDLKSRNHTYLNNQLVEQRTPLRENDSIKICDFMCTFHAAAPPKPLPTVLQRGRRDDDADDGGADVPSTVQATMARVPQQQLLETQPADRLRALLEISSALGAAGSLDGLLDKVADVLLNTFKQADRCFVILRDSATDALHARVARQRRNPEDTPRFSKTIVRKCLETMQAFLSEDASNDAKISLSESITDFRIRSVMVAPLGGPDGSRIGVIQVDTQEKKRFTPDDLKLLMGAANQAAVSIDNAKLHQEDLARELIQRDIKLGEEVQRSFLPQAAPHVDGYQFFHEYKAALTIGGDYYDFIPLPGDRLAVALGDVAGKGVPAALLMAKVNCEARFALHAHPDDPAAAVAAMNDALRHLADMDRYVTFALAVLDPAKHAVTLVNAGHLTPLVYRAATGTLVDAHDRKFGGLPLAQHQPDHGPFEAMTVDLNPGDAVMVYTDGVEDAINSSDKQFKKHGILAALRSDDVLDSGTFTPSQLGGRVMAAVKQHVAGHKPFDDIAMVCFGRHEGLPPGATMAGSNTAYTPVSTKTKTLPEL